MKKTAKDNIKISKAIEKILGITFENEEFTLGAWGDVDNWCRLPDGTLVLLECEKSQKHPNTNVLKLYPYLEEVSDIKVILIHYFFPENHAPNNRVALCDFMGAKLEREFGKRFSYVRLNGEYELIREKLIGLIERLKTLMFVEKS